MTTTLISPLIVAREALITLENNMVMGNLIHRGYEKEYQSIGATVIVRKPTSFTATAFTSTVGYSTITESSVSVILNQHWDVSFEITSQELSLDVIDFTEQFLEPAGRAIAQAVDSTVLSLAGTAIASHYPVTSTPVVSDIAGLAAVLDVMKVPMSQRVLVMHPTTEAAYISLDAFLNADKRGDGPRALKEAELGRVMGFDTYMDQNVKRFDSGATGDLAGALKAAWAVGSTTGTIDAISAGATFAIGDVFKVTGYDEWFLCTAAATATDSTAILTFSPAVKGAMADNAVVTFQDDHKMNLGFHKNAFALVSAPLSPPIGGAKAAVVSHNGLACRVVYGYDQQYKKNQISVDFLCGFKVLDKDLAARLSDAR